MNILEIAKSLLGLLPSVITAVKSVEDLIPDGGKGKDKLELVKNTLQAAYSIGDATLAEFEQIWPAINAVITAVVAFMNAHGIFKKANVIPGG